VPVVFPVDDQFETRLGGDQDVIAYTAHHLMSLTDSIEHARRGRRSDRRAVRLRQWDRDSSLEMLIRRLVLTLHRVQQPTVFSVTNN